MSILLHCLTRLFAVYLLLFVLRGSFMLSLRTSNLLHKYSAYQLKNAGTVPRAVQLQPKRIPTGMLLRMKSSSVGPKKFKVEDWVNASVLLKDGRRGVVEEMKGGWFGIRVTNDISGESMVISIFLLLLTFI
jgi:hypothetical protein